MIKLSKKQAKALEETKKANEEKDKQIAELERIINSKQQ
jgi:hypothetical protein